MNKFEFLRSLPQHLLNKDYLRYYYEEATIHSLTDFSIEINYLEEMENKEENDE